MNYKILKICSQTPLPFVQFWFPILKIKTIAMEEEFSCKSLWRCSSIFLVSENQTTYDFNFPTIRYEFYITDRQRPSKIDSILKIKIVTIE